MEMTMRKIILIAVAVLALILVFCSYTIVEPGNTGVVFNRWTGSLRTAPQGMVIRVPFICDVQSYPTALRTYSMVRRTEEGSAKDDDSIDLPTKEGQHIRQDISVTYNTSEARAADVFRSFQGDDIADIEKTFIRRTIITTAQNAAGQMSLTDIISGSRGTLQTDIEKLLGDQFDKMGFHVDKVNLGASHLPDAIEQQMQQKMAAQQQAQQASFELQKQKVLAQAEVAKAQGQAEAQRVLKQSITPEILRRMAIEKWDGKLPQVTSGGVPMIRLDEAK